MPQVTLQISRKRAAVFLLIVSAALAAQPVPTASAQSATQDPAKPVAHPTFVGDGIKSAAGHNNGAQAASKPEGVGPSKPGEEGLTVHGYWKIDVHNPDGKLVAHREFENSLAAGTGAPPLYQLITGQAAAGDMAINIYDATQPDLCDAGGSGNACYLVISETYGIGGGLCVGANSIHCAAGLTETTNGSSGVTTISANILAAQNTTITTVSTLLLICSSSASGYTTIAPTQCFSVPSGGAAGIVTSYGFFTGTTLPTSLPVNTGQTVSFQVVFTFS